MKIRIFLISFIVFVISVALFYGLSETLAFIRLKTETDNATKYFVAAAETVAPEIKTAFNKSDDIALLFNIERVSHIDGVTEAFIINKDNEIIIHNDSSKWNKKYNDNIYKNILKSADKLVQTFPESLSVIYSVPINENNFLCVAASFENIKTAVSSFKIMLYVVSGIISVLITVMILFLLKFFFLKPYNKTIKQLSLNKPAINTMYKYIIDMAKENVANDTAIGNDKIKTDNSKELFNAVYKKFFEQYEDYAVFAIIDSYAKIVLCSDDDNIIFKKDSEDKHIINGISNSEVIKNISTIIEQKEDFEDISLTVQNNINIEISPLLNEKNNLLGMTVVATIIK